MPALTKIHAASLSIKLVYFIQACSPHLRQEVVGCNIDESIRLRRGINIESLRSSEGALHNRQLACFGVKICSLCVVDAFASVCCSQHYEDGTSGIKRNSRGTCAIAGACEWNNCRVLTVQECRTGSGHSWRGQIQGRTRIERSSRVAGVCNIKSWRIS